MLESLEEVTEAMPLLERHLRRRDHKREHHCSLNYFPLDAYYSAQILIGEHHCSLKEPMDLKT